jgi:hypothetical protein
MRNLLVDCRLLGRLKLSDRMLRLLLLDVECLLWRLLIELLPLKGG